MYVHIPLTCFQRLMACRNSSSFPETIRSIVNFLSSRYSLKLNFMSLIASSEKELSIFSSKFRSIFLEANGLADMILLFADLARFNSGDYMIKCMSRATFKSSLGYTVLFSCFIWATANSSKSLSMLFKPNSLPLSAFCMY